MNLSLPPLSKTFQGEPAFSLNTPEIQLSPDGYTAVIGKNGSGKSTFGEALAESTQNSTRWRWNYLPQYLERFLFAENVVEQLSSLLSQKIDCSRLTDLIQDFGFDDPQKMLEFPFLLMSGGERRRMALVCVFYLHPERLILDEPEIGVTTKENMVLLSKLNNLAARKVRLIIISHNAEFVQQSSDMVCLINGKIARVGRTQELMSDPLFKLDEYGVRFSQ